MILLDTHIWYWWVSQSPRWNPRYQELIEAHADEGLGVSILSCWEIAKKNQLGKLELDRPIEEWIEIAANYPGIEILMPTTQIIMESVNLPNGFRSDPVDEIIVATSRVLENPLLTADQKLLDYDQVLTLS